MDQLEKKLHTVGDLAVQTAQEVAVLRSELQIVFLASGSAITRLTEELAAYNEGKAAVAHGTAERGPPLKVRLYRKLLQCVEAQAEPFPAITRNAIRPPPEGKPWILVCTFAASESGRALRRLWGAPALAGLWTKMANGAWPSVGVKAGVPRPSRKVLAAVADAVGVSVKGKGKGEGGPSHVSPKRSASGRRRKRNSPQPASSCLG